MTVSEIIAFPHEDEDTQNLRESLSLSHTQRLTKMLELTTRLKKIIQPNKRIADDFIQNLIGILEKNNLQYLVVGGYAVNVHGYTRASDDFDIWLNNTTANLSNFRRTLLGLGIEQQKVYDLVSTLAKPNDATVYRFKIEGNNVDFLMQLKGIPDFESAYQQRVLVKLANVQIPFISLEDLVRSKTAVNRTKDRLDLEMLLQIREEAKEKL
jgi:hypothetical protein